MHRRGAAMAFIFVTVLLDMLAFGIIVPVFQPLLLHFEGGNFTNASLLSGAFSMIFALVQFFASPLLGTLSDRFGRRPVVLLSNLGTSFDYAILALAPSVPWLLLGRVLSGATTASVTVASAYIADVTPAEKRASGYAMISAAFGIGFVVGPALGGLLGAHDLRLPFWVAAGLSAVNFLYGLIVLPESLREEHRNPFSWSRAHPLGSVRLLRRHPELSGLAIVSAISGIAHQALPQLFVLYTIYAFGWTQRTIGISLALVGVLTIVISSVVIPRVVARFGERNALLGGLFFGAAGFTLYALSETLFWIGLGINMLDMLGSSASQALMSRRVGANEQGELQGAMTMLNSVGMLIGPLFFSSIFALSIAPSHTWKLPGAGWIAGALLYVLCIVLAARVTRGSGDAPETMTGTPEGMPAVETP
jgi:DHA1 family tetracycline resistance protein-like MFS transporter